MGQTLQLTLTPSNYNNFNISCFGKKDGAIDLTVTGGQPPYTFLWSNGLTTEDQVAQPAGYYHVEVRDENGQGVEAQITLTEPEQLSADHMVSSYPNGYNISCYDCYNGSILLYANGGAPPYTYVWEDGPTTADRFNLGSNTYAIVVTDANQCLHIPETFFLNEPERSDWTLFGNTGSNPQVHFIGTIDNKDVTFKTYNTERLRIKGNGEILINGLTPGPLFMDANGILRSSGQNQIAGPCNNVNVNIPVWSSLSSGEFFTCQPFRIGIGTHDIPSTVRFKVDGVSWFDGNVTVGIDPGLAQTPPANPYRLLVNGKFGATEIYCSIGTPWPDYVFEDDYELLNINTLRHYVSKNKHLPGVPSAGQLESKGANVMELMSKAYEKIEELHLYIFELEDRLLKLEGKK